MDQIKLILFIALAVISLVLIIVLFRKASRDRINSEIDRLQVAFNEIRTTPLSMKFNTAQAVAKRNDETDKEIKEYYSRYTNAQSVIDEVDNLLINVENNKREHNYRDIKKIIPTLQEKLAICSKEIKETDEFLKKYEHKETEQRSYSTNLKQQFQVVRDTIRKNANQLSLSYDAISEKLDECSNLFTKSEDALFANDYLTAQETLELIDKKMHDIKLVVNELPPIIKDATVVIPTLIEEAESSSSYIKQKGVYIEHLNVKQTVDSVSDKLKECSALVSKLEIDGVATRIGEIKAEIQQLNSSLNNEDSQYTKAKDNMRAINDNINDIKNTIDFIQFSTDNNENLYANKEDKPNTVEYDERLIKIKTSSLELSTRLEILTEPASELNKTIEDLLKESIEVKEGLSSLKDNLDKSVGDVQRAKASLIKFQLVVNQAEISVKASHLPSISDSFAEDLKECKRRIKEIRQMLNESTVDLESLNIKVKDSMNYIYNFSNNVKNLVGLSIMTENAIVFGNKFRSSHPDIDSDLSKSEFSFLNGEYTKAVQLAIKTMDTLYPDSKKEIPSVNN